MIDIFVALQAGTVPIYLGAQNIVEFDPLYEEGPNGTLNHDFKPKSLIRVSDFKNAEELVKFITELASDEERYNTYLEWKTLPPTPRFQRLVDMSLDYSDTACRICKYVAREKQKKEKSIQ